MKICRITADNFRTLQSFDLELQKNYCTISGKNNAGKSAILKIIQHFFDDNEEERYFSEIGSSITFEKDKTQWGDAEKMSISVEIQLDKIDDSETFYVVEKFSESTQTANTIHIKLTHEFFKDSQQKLSCVVNGKLTTERDSKEILRKLRFAPNLIVHNSTTPSHRTYFMGGSLTEILDAYFSSEDRKKISDAEKKLQNHVKRATRQHKDELDKLLGKLNDKYQVELTSPQRGGSSRFPLQIKLTDKSVAAPLVVWGAGTQNRTRILMSVLEAIRIRKSATASDRSTPVFLVEEPESFLHPSAQAEFGQVLNGLAQELEIQIIATTHSPYMLNQNDPNANILLDRKISRGLLKETTIKSTDGDDWMIPFSENLGIIPREFKSWEPIFNINSNKILLVEGEIDREYFHFIRDHYPSIYALSSDVDIVPYNGKDALKNTAILQFMLKKFRRSFITFDLDAEKEIKPALERIGLTETADFIAIGINEPGAACIEGLLPSETLKSVYAANFNLVTALGSASSTDRNSAKNKLKKALLDEFRATKPPEAQLKKFKDLFININKSMSQKI